MDMYSPSAYEIDMDAIAIVTYSYKQRAKFQKMRGDCYEHLFFSCS